MRARMLLYVSAGNIDGSANVMNVRSIHSMCQSAQRSTQVNAGHAKLL
jgi:hypothetical protein